MLVVDTPISKKYWLPFYKFAVRCFAAGKYEQVDENIYLMHRGKRLLYVGGVELNGVVHICGWLLLEQKNDWVCWQVAQSFVFYEHRGLGWGKLLYSHVINEANLILASGHQQSVHGRQMWKRMIASGSYTIWAHDFDDDSIYAPVEYDKDEDEIYCRLPIYEQWWQGDSDIRLIAIKKEGK